MLKRLYHNFLDIEPERLRLIVTAAVVVLLMILIVPQLISVFKTYNYSPSFSSSPPIKPKDSPDYNVNNIISNNLFGANPSANNTGASFNLPNTRLQLELHGAFSSNNPELSSAIIKGPDGDSRSYKINNRIYDQATLHQVFNDKVVLSRDGRLENLYFPDVSADNNKLNNVSSTSVNKNARNFTVPAGIKQLVQENMTSAEIQQASKQLRNSALTPAQREQLIRTRLQELRNRAKNKK